MKYIPEGKRCLDIVVAAAALILLLPFLLVISAIIYLRDGSPVFFLHTRMGWHGKRFSLLKFRSMRVHQDQVGEAAPDTDMAQLTALRQQFKGTQKGDPRITPTGHFLRKTHLDELPQLWNVLVGDMSLIGPRPDTPVQISDYEPAMWEYRCSVRPGITGLAQIMAHKVQTDADRQTFDKQYIERLSFAQDMHILLKTVAKIFKANSF